MNTTLNNGRNGVPVLKSAQIETLPLPVSPGAFEHSDNYYKVFSKEHSPLHPDRKVILAAAWNGSGEPVVRHHHEQIFNAEWAGDEQVLLQVAHDIAGNVRSGEAHERELEARLSATNRYPDENGGAQPWTGWAVAELVAMILFSFLLLAVDVNSAATTLMNSGLDTFRGHYGRAALFNLALIIGGAFLVKAFSRLFHTDASRRRYAIAVGIVAALSLACSLPLFAQTYARMTADPIALMTGNTTTVGIQKAAWTFAFQILTGNLIAGFMWLMSALIIERHSPKEPSWKRIKDDLDSLSALLRKEREKLGLVQAGLARIGAQRDQLVTCAVEQFKLAQEVFGLNNKNPLLKR
jgi:hypothetical protein